VNFELPNISEDYVHRIGRTGRAGSSGAAISLVDREEIKYLNAIERLLKREIPRLSIEGFVPPVRTEQEEARPPRQHRPQQRQGAPKSRSGGARSARRDQMHHVLARTLWPAKRVLAHRRSRMPIGRSNAPIALPSLSNPQKACPKRRVTK